MSHVLSAVGLTVPHEQVGEHGTVSDLFVVDDYHYLNRHREGRLRDFDFTVTLHQVRHPLHVIASLMNFDKVRWWHWQHVHTGISFDLPPIKRCAMFWLAWNALCERQAAFTYRIEDLDKAWPKIASVLSIVAPLPEVQRHGESRHASLEWSDLEAWEEPVRKRAVEYGYDA